MNCSYHLQVLLLEMQNLQQSLLPLPIFSNSPGWLHQPSECSSEGQAPRPLREEPHSKPQDMRALYPGLGPEAIRVGLDNGLSLFSKDQVLQCHMVSHSLPYLLIHPPTSFINYLMPGVATGQKERISPPSRPSFLKIYNFIYLFYFWLCWVYVASCGLVSSRGEQGLFCS